MSRHKALPLAFLTMTFAIGALSAPVAQATEFFHSHKERTIITAENTGTGMTAPHTFQLVAGLANTKAECTAAKFEGTEVGAKHESEAKGTTFTDETLTLTPTYSGCTLNGNVATVDTTTGECQFKFFAATTETEAGKPHGSIEIICAAGKTIDISVPALGVVIHVGNQLIPHALNYTNVNTAGGTENEEVTITATSPKNISWSCTPKALCIAGLGANSGTEAAYAGLATAKGYRDKTPPLEEGAQTGIWKGPEE